MWRTVAELLFNLQVNWKPVQGNIKIKAHKRSSVLEADFTSDWKSRRSLLSLWGENSVTTKCRRYRPSELYSVISVSV